MIEFPEVAEELESKEAGSLGAGTLVFVGGMALAAASFVVEHYIVKSLQKR